MPAPCREDLRIHVFEKSSTSPPQFTARRAVAHRFASRMCKELYHATHHLDSRVKTKPPGRGHLSGGCCIAIDCVGSTKLVASIVINSDGLEAGCLCYTSPHTFVFERKSEVFDSYGDSVSSMRFKPLAISTGPLKSFRILHSQPIDVVVYDGPSFPKETETLSRGGLHA